MADNIEIAISFDTTGSMRPCIQNVRQNVEALFAPLFKEIPNLKIAVCAHGDYCDESHYYLTKWLPLTGSLFDLTQFVRNVGNTGGGDAPEAYEHVLWEARSLDWSVNSKKILIMIGDEVPHGPNYPLNKRHTDWNVELKELVNIGVNVYGVQCLSKSSSNAFYSKLAQASDGFHLTLDQFSSISDMLLAIIYKQVSPERLEKFEQEVETKKRMNRAMDDTFNVLSGRPRDSKGRFTKLTPDLAAVPAGRFQILSVPEDTDIRGFVEAQDLTFKKGRGFYEFTKTEDIQENKEVVLRDHKTGDMFSGPKAREMIGVPLGTRGRVRPAALPYQIFVQSTSVNRKLIHGTNFLYEVDLDA